MSVDTDPACGTLVGLTSKLVLRGPDEDRLVLVPEGSVLYSKAGDHVAVHIDRGTVTKVYAYQLDTTLGRLVYHGNLQGRLYLCYLHALTSFCLPDPLTNQTGTESAISILRSGAVRSFDVLTRDNMHLLKLIAGLSPKRRYYPQNLKVMQQVQWDSGLSFFSQSSILYTLVKEIFAQAQRGGLLYPPENYTAPPLLEHVDHLLQRDLGRTALFRVSEYGAENYTLGCDNTYLSRDRDQGSERGKRSFIAATLILRDNAALHCKPTINLYGALRQKYFQDGTIHGPKKALPRLEFDVKWLSDASSQIPILWCSLHSSLANFSSNYNKFNIMMWLSTIAFAEKADMDIIGALSAFYRMEELKFVEIPQIDRFDLSDGSAPSLTKLENLLLLASRPFKLCPEATLPKMDWESNNAMRKRRATSFENNRGAAISAFAKALKDQWPCQTPTTPATDTANTYLKVQSAMDQVSESFNTWYENHCFFLYLEALCNILERQAVKQVLVTPCHLTVASTPASDRHVRYLSAIDIFASPAPSFRPAPPDIHLPLEQMIKSSADTKAGSLLTTLCQDLDTRAKSPSEKDYVLQLKQSFTVLQQSFNDHWTAKTNSAIAEMLNTYLRDCKAYFEYMTHSFEQATKGASQQSYCFMATYIKHCPRTSPTFWLRQLNKNYWDGLSKKWRSAVVQYGLAITELQRAHRLLSVSENSLELAKEFRNRGHQNWNPSNFPESLLLEAESGIMIREVQEEIARLMRNPPNDQNAVMQLNMGEGKSTVIVPVVAAALADKSR
jgi:hypothetical protein